MIGLGCGGRQVPEHDGYRDRWVIGWKKPQVLELDEDFESENDGELSYPKRKRVRWFAVDLPEDGTLEVSLAAAPLGQQQGEAELEDEEDPFDVGVEVYSQGFKLLARSDRESDSAGERQKTLAVNGLLKGRYLVHLYVQRRLDEAEYTLRVKFKRGSAEAETDFPTHVQFVGDLPVVPVLDDSPEPEPVKPRCRGSKCGRKKPDPKPEEKPEPSEVATTTTPDAMSARIVQVRALASGGTSIVLNKGEAQGVQAGWTGVVVTKTGAPLPDGEFTISSVKANSSSAQVKISPDAVKQSARVKLKKP